MLNKGLGHGKWQWTTRGKPGITGVGDPLCPHGGLCQQLNVSYSVDPDKYTIVAGNICMMGNTCLLSSVSSSLSRRNLSCPSGIASNVFLYTEPEIWKRNRKNWTEKSHDMHVILWTAPYLKYSPSKLKRNAGVYEFLRFEERFWKAPFSWQISVFKLLQHSVGPALLNHLFFAKSKEVLLC